MNEVLKNKKILLFIGLALVLGGLLGWWVKPSSTAEQAEAEVHSHEEANSVWTCSMHPQVRQSEPGQCPICGMDLIPVSSGVQGSQNGAAVNPMVHQMTPEAVAMANIHTTKVTGGAAAGEIQLTGKVKADERLMVSVTAKFPGRIEKLYVNFTGQTIKRGERLATIYSPELLTAQKELLEAVTTKEVYPELYVSAFEKLKLWKLSDAQIQAIEQTGKVNELFDVLADNSGVVSQRNVSLGDYVSTGSVLFSIVDLSKVWIVIDAYETDLPFVKVGNELSFTTQGSPGKVFSAKITYIDPIINAATRTAAVRADAGNQNGELKPEMFVSATIRTSSNKKPTTMTIPRTALLWSGKRSIVYVKVQDTEFPSFEMREVTIGSRMGEMYMVEAGLEAGEEVVTNGLFSVDAAAQLSGNYSMMSRPDTKTMEVSEVFRGQITAVAQAYFDVKNSLVDDDITATIAASKKLNLAIGKVEMNTLEGEIHTMWMSLSKNLSSTASAMTESKDIDILRTYFGTLSENILEMTESFGLQNDKVYKDFCPMAFDNKGAFWLSEKEEILNPYFGSAMLSCGEVKETYRKGQPVFAKEGSKSAATGGHDH